MAREPQITQNPAATNRCDVEQTAAPQGDANLIQMIARGFAARDELLAMSEADVLVTPRTRIRHLQRYARLAYLAPDIIRAILDGSQPRHLTARYLLRDAPLPLSWTEQRQALGFPAN